MRKLIFELTINASVEKLWPLLAEIENYPRYIKYCRKAFLIGDFREGSTWYDWSTVVYLPLKIKHEIIRIQPNKEIIYKIGLPVGEIWQKLSLEVGEQTKVWFEITIDFPNPVIDKTLGALVYYRNRKMIEATIANFEKGFGNADN